MNDQQDLFTSTESRIELSRVHFTFPDSGRSPSVLQPQHDGRAFFHGRSVFKVLGKCRYKSEARKIAEAAKVPVVPGSEGLITSEEEAVRLVRGIAYPVLIKAVAKACAWPTTTTP